MQSRLQTPRRHASAVLFLLLALVAGCGPSLPTTYPVKGRIELTDGDVADLADANIEVIQETDKSARASGTIAADGSFELESLHSGVLVRGALAGDYLARIVLTDDGGREATKKRRAAIHPRFLSPSSSGLSFTVPAPGPVVLKVSRK